MSVLAKLGSSTRLNNLTTLDTLQATKTLQELRGNRAEQSPQTSRSAPGEKSKYQLWPAVDQRVPKPLPGCLERPALHPLDRKRSIRIHQSAEQMWLYYRKGEKRPPPPDKFCAKRTQSSPKNTPQPMLDVAQVSSTAHTNRRSCSAPGRTHQNETLRPHEEVSTDYEERMSLFNVDRDEQACEAGEHRRSLKRASSVVLPAELAAIVFPKLERRAFNADGRKIEAPDGPSAATILRGEFETETPPAVPPKTLPKKSTPALHVSPLKLRPTKGPACDKALPQIVAAASPPLTTVDSVIGQGESKHVRDGSGDSMIDRGRPMRRSRSQSGRGFLGSCASSSVDLPNDTLPKGWSANSISANLSRQEIRKLEHQARGQVGRFEVLHPKDVKALSQQVRLLDEQCEYLRGFAKSLRRNRRTLHAQTIAYLKSPALSEIPRASILQKVETLADLDDTIDDWAKKLERAEDQRLRTRQSLLEHLAAVLAMPSVIDSQGGAGGGLGLRLGPEQTPPQSPEGLKSPPMTARYEGESIKIYAGSEMHALLGVLEQETAALNGMENGLLLREMTFQVRTFHPPEDMLLVAGIPPGRGPEQSHLRPVNIDLNPDITPGMVVRSFPNRLIVDRPGLVPRRLINDPANAGPTRLMVTRATPGEELTTHWRDKWKLVILPGDAVATLHTTIPL